MAEHNSPERRADLLARHKARRYEGAHIRQDVPHAPPSAYEVSPTDPETDVQALALQVDALTDMWGKFLMGQNGAKPVEGADVTVPKPRFDGTINTGNILVLLTLLLGGIGAWGTYTADMAKRDARIDALQESIVRAGAETGKVRQEGEARALKYAPMIETAAQVNGAQASTINAITESLRQVRDLLTDLGKAQAATDKALAVWIAQHSHGEGPSGPVGR